MCYSYCNTEANTDKKMHIAGRDIPVYKNIYIIIHKNGSTSYKSGIRKYEYKIGKTYKLGKIRRLFSAFGSLRFYRIFCTGNSYAFHSYDKFSPALVFKYINAEFTIPKGARYYNNGFEYASDSIRFDGVAHDNTAGSLFNSLFNRRM